MQHFDANSLLSLNDRYRTNLINSLHGARPAMLIGTKNKQGNTNLALFSQVLHLGANPALCGILFRPDSVDRHTLQNIRETGFFTLNSTTEGMEDRAHQTSARYAETVSEFDACGFEAEYREGFFAPFVAESPVKIGLKAQPEIRIEANGTILLLGAVEHLFVHPDILAETGHINHHHAKSLAVAGLDTYVGLKPIARFSYAKPDQALQKLEL